MLGIDILRLAGSGGSSGDSGSGILMDTSVGGTQYAQWTMSFDGFTYRRNKSGVSTRSYAWLSPQLGMSEYEVRATLVGGDLPPGTFDAWMSMAFARTWGWTAQTTSHSCDILIELRRASDAAVVDSCTVSLFTFGIE